MHFCIYGLLWLALCLSGPNFCCFGLFLALFFVLGVTSNLCRVPCVFVVVLPTCLLLDFGWFIVVAFCLCVLA